jgi:hypothetical protein
VPQEGGSCLKTKSLIKYLSFVRKKVAIRVIIKNIIVDGSAVNISISTVVV